MGKSDRKQVDRALGLLHSDARLAARSLAAIQRAANSKTQREIAEIVDAHPGIKQHLTTVNGCLVERGAA